MTQPIVALLPLKAHSERVPRKNFMSIAGKPLVRWMLDRLLAIDEIKSVVINTDAREELSQIGVVDTDRIKIRDRKKGLCGDFVSMNRVLEDDIDNVASSHYLMTHTTNPLISESTVRAAMQTYVDSLRRHDSLFTVNRIQTRFYRKDGAPVNHDPDNLVRTQDLEPWFEENSCLYFFTAESFRKTGARIGERPLLFETPKLESVDIDEPEDWDLAEALLLQKKKSIFQEGI